MEGATFTLAQYATPESIHILEIRPPARVLHMLRGMVPL